MYAWCACTCRYAGIMFVYTCSCALMSLRIWFTPVYARHTYTATPTHLQIILSGIEAGDAANFRQVTIPSVWDFRIWPRRGFQAGFSIHRIWCLWWRRRGCGLTQQTRLKDDEQTTGSKAKSSCDCSSCFQTYCQTTAVAAAVAVVVAGEGGGDV